MFKKVIDIFSRVFVGALFIFSGLIKLNDPIGTKIKLEEYFEVFASDFGSFFEFFIPFALPIGMLLIVLEVVLGVAVLLNYKMKTTMTIMLSLMVFFTFLTFYSAYFNKVTDCGCFGDAIPLNPWQSFYKDLILMVFVMHLFWYRSGYEPMLRARPSHFIIGGVTLISFMIGIMAILHLPYIDFRPYKIGNSIPQKMIPEESPILEYTFERDGEEVTSLKFLSADEGYKYLDSRILNEKASTAKITDYQVVGTDGNDYTEESFTGSKLFIIFYDTTFDNKDKMQQLSNLVDGLQNAEAMVLTSAGEAEFEAYRHEHQLAAPYYFLDATVLKAMIRSSPGIMLVKDGVVYGKWHYNDLPEAAYINALSK